MGGRGAYGIASGARCALSPRLKGADGGGSGVGVGSTGGDAPIEISKHGESGRAGDGAGWKCYIILPIRKGVETCLEGVKGRRGGVRGEGCS